MQVRSHQTGNFIVNLNPDMHRKYREVLQFKYFPQRFRPSINNHLLNVFRVVSFRSSRCVIQTSCAHLRLYLVQKTHTIM